MNIASYLKHTGLAMIAIALLGCGGGSDTNGVAVQPTQSTPPPQPPTAEAPLLSEALDCIDTPESAVPFGTAFKRVTLPDENALCNDGSRAVMYIRRAQTVAGEDNWSINFQGGGNCLGTDCAERWCDINNRMTAASAPEGSDFGGLFSRTVENEQPDANQVFLYYCSSDNFAGRKSDVVIAETDTTPEFRIHFQGATILESVLETLGSGAIADDQTTSLPALGGTGLFTISGTSAGCGAIARQGDRVAEFAASLGHTTRIICDGNFPPDTPFLPDDTRRDTVVTALEMATETRNQNHDPVRDESCLTLQTESPWRCDLASYVLANHITSSPLFVRMDLGDPTIARPYIGIGYSAAEFAAAVRTGLLAASGGSSIESPSVPPSVFAPACGNHVALFSSDVYFNTTIGDGASSQSLNDAMGTANNGTQVVLVDTFPPTLSTCSN